jgi:hypothetical protein
MDILRQYGVGDIDDIHRGQNIEDHTLHAGDIGTGQTEVGCEGDGWWCFAKRIRWRLHVDPIVTVNNLA